MSETYPLISLILPVFNAERFIEETLNSIAAQEYPNLEIIVINDGSTDRSLEIIQSFPMKMRVISQENKGVYPSRNLALSIAKGEFIAFCDSDDILCKGHLKTLSEYLVANPEVEIVKSNLQRVIEKNGQLINEGNPHSEVFSLAASLFRNYVFRRIGTFANDLVLAADADWHLRSVEAGLNIKQINFLSFYYRFHNTNITNDTAAVKSARLEVLRRKIIRAKNRAND
jgi:glycosyltransferase involved in cell wall biosynthesis